jgi:hypothetical protein
MKNFCIILFLILGGCSHRVDQIDYRHTPLPSPGFSLPMLEPPTIRVPSAPSDSIVTINPHSFTPVMPYETQIKLQEIKGNWKPIKVFE